MLNSYTISILHALISLGVFFFFQQQTAYAIRLSLVGSVMCIRDSFPTNRCVLHACQLCGQHVLRYTEFGGYYIDHRARRLDPEVIVDTA